MEIQLEEALEEGSTCIGIYVRVKGAKGKVAPRDQLIYTVLERIYSQGKPWDATGAGPFLSIAMPCGNQVSYDKSSDVPWESVPCPCGNPNHWVIKYEEED